MQRIYATGKPVVTVYIQGRPMDMNLANEKSNALLTLWYPGMEGGSALADILWGDYNPAGRLPISIPRSVGQIPVYYSQPATGDYVEESSKPLYPFGYGLSYTQFEYGDLRVDSVPDRPGCLSVHFTVRNVGPCDGDEVVQLYVRDEVASVAPASKLLKCFERVHIKKGETVELHFELLPRDLSVYSSDQGWHQEGGAFTIMVGGNSEETKIALRF